MCPGYSISDVIRLVEGERLDQRTGMLEEVRSSWIGLRSHIERTGYVDSEQWAEVLDAERAVDALRNCGCSRSNLDGSGRRPRCSHKLAALVLLAAMHQWDPAEMQATFARLHTPWETLLDKAEAHMQAYLSSRGERARREQAQKALSGLGLLNPVRHRCGTKAARRSWNSGRGDESGRWPGPLLWALEDLNL